METVAGIMATRIRTEMEVDEVMTAETKNYKVEGLAEVETETKVCFLATVSARMEWMMCDALRLYYECGTAFR